MICVSITENNVEKAVKYLNTFDFCELRLDLIKPSDRDLPLLFETRCRKIITCREAKAIDRISLLKKSLKFSPDYIDIEFETDLKEKKELIDLCEKFSVKRIHSYHNFDKTPDKNFLVKIIEGETAEFCPDIVKIATRVNNKKDNAVLLSLLETDYPLVVVGMGEKGKITRLVAPLLGSKFTFASVDGKSSAPGQIDYFKMKRFYKTMEDFLK